MSLPYIILITLGVVFGLIFLIVIMGKISTSRKDVSKGGLAKKVEKIKKNSKKTNITIEKKDDFILKEKEEEPPKEEKKNRDGKPIVSNFEDFDEKDKELLGLKPVSQSEADLAEDDNVKRKSIEEIMRNRSVMGKQQPQRMENQRNDDFEEFRSQHSSYTSYMKDNALVDEIKNLSPEMRAIVFNSLFAKIDHDKF